MLPFSQVNQTLTLWQQVRLRVASFFLPRTGLVKNNRVLWPTSKRFFFFPPSARSRRESHSDIYCGNLTKLLEINLTILWGLCMPGPPGIFKLSELTTWSIQHLSITIRVFLIQHWFSGQFSA